MHPWHKNTLRSTPTQGYFLQSGLTKVIPKNSSHSEPRLYSLSPNFFLLIMKIQFTLNLLCLVGFLCNSTYTANISVVIITIIHRVHIPIVIWLQSVLWMVVILITVHGLQFPLFEDLNFSDFSDCRFYYHRL